MQMDGYNCGLFCALFAEYLFGNRLCKFSSSAKPLKPQRLQIWKNMLRWAKETRNLCFEDSPMNPRGKSDYWVITTFKLENIRT